MMANYFKKKTLIFIIFIFCLVCLNILEKDIRNLFYLFSSPFQRIFFIIGQKISWPWESIFAFSQLEKEKNDLIAENQALKSELSFLKELKKENETLRETLGLGMHKDFKLLFADITSKNLSEDFILINKGSIAGMLPNMPVVTSQKILVGKVGKTYTNFSKVIIISNKQSAFPAKVQEKEIYGVIKGIGQGEVLLDLIPQDAEVQTGDKIITVALDNIFPKNLLIGEVKKVQKSDLAPYQKAEIIPYFDLKGLNALFVIIE